MSRDRRRGHALTAVAVTLPLAAVLATAGPAQANDRQAIAGTHPTWARASADRGTTDGAQPVDARVWLSGRDPKGLNAYALAVSTPGNPLYRKFLTPAQFKQRFGPTQQQVDAVTSWLRGSGLHVDAAGSNFHFIHVTGQTKDAGKAFGTGFHNYSQQGTVVRAPDGNATVPASVAPAVLTVTGLDTAKILVTAPTDRTSAASTAATGRHAATDVTKDVATPVDQLPPAGPNSLDVAEPCSSFYGDKIATDQPPAFGGPQPYAMCGLEPQQLRNAYGATATGLTGKGVTVALVVPYVPPNVEKVVDTFAAKHGGKPFAAGQFREVLPPTFDVADPAIPPAFYRGAAGVITEVHDVAPDANIVYVGAESDDLSKVNDGLLKIVDGHLADFMDITAHVPSEVVSQDVQDAFDATFKQGAAEGIGAYAPSGAFGSDDPAVLGTAHRETEVPASSPWVTAVGGTSLAVGSDEKYLFETGWNDMSVGQSADGKSWATPPPGTYPNSYFQGSGGGVSDAPQPAYQAGVVPDSLSKTLPDGTQSATPMRTVPDIAAAGDFDTGVRFASWSQLPDGSFGYAESNAGSTVTSTALIVGLQALAQQHQGQPIGFANPAIYQRSHLTHDVTDQPLGKGPIAFVDPFLSNTTGQVRFFLDTTGNVGIPSDAALPATTGYDEITGIGTPTAGYLQSFVGTGTSNRPDVKR